MLVFWKQKLVMLALPKTGTTALEAALLPLADAAILNPPGLKHVSAQRYRNLLAGFFEQRGSRPMETMAVMRDPAGWLESWYRYRTRPQLDGKDTSTAGISFDDFVDAWMRADQPEFARVGSQANFLTNDAGQIAVDHIFRHDMMDAAVTFLEARLNTRITLERRNTSPVRDVALSPAMAARLRAERPGEFEIWERLRGDGSHASKDRGI